MTNQDSIRDNTQRIILDKVPLEWDFKSGNLTFFGMDSALFWTNPSLSNMLTPIVDEIGADLFRLLVSYSSSLGTEEDYHAMISTFANNFEDGFLAWGEAVSIAGWGSFEMIEYNPMERQATVIVKNSWEMSAQRNIPPEKRWGTPFILGKLIGIFSHAFHYPCWAIDSCIYADDAPYVEIKIFESNMTIMDELRKIREQRMIEKERELSAMVECRTWELQQAKAEIEKHSAVLEQRVEERTANLSRLNKELEDEIKNRQKAEAKLAELNKELLELCRTDALTNLSNRRHFDNVLSMEWSRALRSQCPLCLIIGDVDYFKKYNDSYGHQEGDHCLQSVANLLKRKFNRVSDVVARYGGEEFAMILPITKIEQAEDIVKSLLADLGELNIPHAFSEFAHITMSFGLTSVVPRNDQTIGHFLKIADDALYMAKKTGRNRYVKLFYE